MNRGGKQEHRSRVSDVSDESSENISGLLNSESSEWQDEWPSLHSVDKLRDYMFRFERPEISDGKVASRADRDTTNSDSTWTGESFEEILAGKHIEDEINLSGVEGDSRENFSPANILAVPENPQQRDYDALIPVEADEGIDLKEVQIKGCFHSRKNNPDRNSHIVIPYDTHHNNGDDYIYHVGTYSLDDEVGMQIPVKEAVLDHEEMDALLTYVKWLNPTLTSVNDTSKGRLRAQIDPDIIMDYAEEVQDRRGDLDKSGMYELAESALLDYAAGKDLQEAEDQHLNAFRVPQIETDSSTDENQYSLIEFK